MKKKFKTQKVKALLKLMESVGVLCEVVRTTKKELLNEGYTYEDLQTIEDIAGQAF